MKRIALCLCLTLAACTGSFEQGLPTLLIIGYGAEEGNLALVQEVRSAGSGTVNFELLDVVDDLPGEILDYDIVDRKGLRTKLVVLTRTDEDELFINIFEINNIVFDGEGAVLEPNPDDRNSRPINLSDEELYPDDTEPLTLRADSDDEVIVQVDEEGRYIAVLSESNTTTTESRFIVVDIEANRNTEVELLNDIDGVENDVLFLDQDAERLYFLQDESNGQNLIYLNLDDRSTPTNIFEEIDSGRAIPGSTSLTGSVRELNKLGGTLLALQQEQFVSLNLGSDFEPGTPIDTLDNAEAFIPLDTTQQSPLILYSDDELALYRTLTDEADIAEDTPILAGSVQSQEGFIYFLRDQNPPLAVFDLQSYLRDTSQELDAFDLVSFEVRNAAGEEVALPNPVFVEWTRAVIRDE